MKKSDYENLSLGRVKFIRGVKKLLAQMKNLEYTDPFPDFEKVWKKRNKKDIY
jgi:hypothetical protein